MEINWDFYLNKLIKKKILPLSPVYPLSFSEFMSVYPDDKYEGLSEYMLYGGIPLVVLREGTEDKAAALENLLEDLLNILSSAIGSLTTPEKLKNTFKTVKKSMS